MNWETEPYSYFDEDNDECYSAMTLYNDSIAVRFEGGPGFFGTDVYIDGKCEEFIRTTYWDKDNGKCEEKSAQRNRFEFECFCEEWSDEYLENVLTGLGYIFYV